MDGPQTPPPPHDAEGDQPQIPSRTSRVIRGSARGVSKTSKAAYVRARRFTHAEGAGESGLSRLMELHAFNAAGDIAVAIALAGTIFFLDPDAARFEVARFLLLTMLPFAIVAPLLGPFLDRFRRGRRWAIGATMALRAWMCWILAGAVENADLTLFFAALGCLVASKAYGITRAAAVPRVLPPGLNLVRANSRVSLSGTGGALVSAPLAGLFAMFGAEWTLRFAFVIFVAATAMAILLPEAVDDTVGEEDPKVTPVRAASQRSNAYGITPSVVKGLRCNVALRFIAGFLSLFMVFVLQEQSFEGWENRTFIIFGLVVAAAGIGNTIGVFLGSLIKSRAPETIVVAVVIADVIALVIAAFHWTIWTAILISFAAGLCQFLGKMGIDALIQRDVLESVRTSVFARSETVQQLAWVIGGFVGLGLALSPAQVGLWVAAALTVLWFVWAIVWRNIREQRAQQQNNRPTQWDDEAN